MFVGGRYAIATIHHDERDIGFLERPHRLFDHALVNTLFTAGDTAGIDNNVGNRAEPAETVLTITRQPGIVGNNRITRSSESIEQRRLADVRPANECNDGEHRNLPAYPIRILRPKSPACCPAVRVAQWRRRIPCHRRLARAADFRQRPARSRRPSGRPLPARPGHRRSC